MRTFPAFSSLLLSQHLRRLYLLELHVDMLIVHWLRRHLLLRFEDYIFGTSSCLSSTSIPLLSLEHRVTYLHLVRRHLLWALRGGHFPSFHGLKLRASSMVPLPDSVTPILCVPRSSNNTYPL